MYSKKLACSMKFFDLDDIFDLVFRAMFASTPDFDDYMALVLYTTLCFGVFGVELYGS